MLGNHDHLTGGRLRPSSGNHCDDPCPRQPRSTHPRRSQVPQPTCYFRKQVRRGNPEVDSIAVSLSTNRRQVPNTYYDTGEVRALSTQKYSPTTASLLKASGCLAPTTVTTPAKDDPKVHLPLSICLIEIYLGPNCQKKS